MSPGSIANAAAWAVLLALAAMALVATAVLGFMGLLLLGLATVLVCTLTTLNDETPTWGADVFRARMQPGGRPEDRARQAAERTERLSPLRFYRWCGIGLTVVGAAGLAWQGWG